MSPPDSADVAAAGPPSGSDAPTVAFDVGPLHGSRTGVGHAVAGTLAALESRPDVAVTRYLTSVRARVDRTTRRLPLPAAVAMRWWPHWSPPLDRLLGGPDVVHGTNYVVPPTQCPSAVSVYDCWFLEHEELAAPDVRRAANVLRRCVADGATVVASSAATETRVRELLGTDRVRTVLLGPPAPGPKVAPPDIEQPPYFLAIGTIERRKNYSRLVKAFARVCTEHPTVRLVIVGRDGDDRAALDRALTALDRPTSARISVLGEVDAVGTARLLAGATALAYPSLDEGFGFPILEAAQAGVAVVASAAGSIPEIAANAALLSPPTDIDALAANLHWVLTDDGIRRKLIARGKRNVKRFSWERTGDELVELYRELADGRSGAAR